MYEQNLKMCWICNTKSVVEKFVQFNKDGSAKFESRCTNPDCPTHKKILLTN